MFHWENNHIFSVKKTAKVLTFLMLLILISSCGLKLSLRNNSNENKILISGVVSPLSGAITSQNSFSLFLSTANAVSCADPVYAKLFLVQNDGSVDESNPLTSQLIEADARYTFDANALGLLKKDNVQYLVKAEGCNGNIYKRPITDFNNNQDIDAKTTIISEVVNANTLLATTLNNAKRSEVEDLIKAVSGNSISQALTSLTTETDPVTKFTEIFGTSPSAIQNGKPSVTLNPSSSILNELQVATFSAQAFHIDPNYSFAYSWKINGVVKSHANSLSYIPSANESGVKTIDFYAGKDDGHGDIDLTKPYYTKSFTVMVDNSILPVAPNITLNASNPSPVLSNTVVLDIGTGVSLANCATFSHLAITDTNATPGIMQFNIDCSVSGAQTQSVSITPGDGSKTLYIWAIDSVGQISPSKSLNLILDTLPPSGSLTFTPTLIKGGTTQTVTLSASDAGAGLSTLALYYSATGANPYSLVSTLSLNATSYSWVTPADNTTTAKLKLTATDLAGRTTDIVTSAFEIDSLAPTAPGFTRTSSALTNSTTVTSSIGSCAGTSAILINETNTAPLAAASGWVSCSTLTSNYSYTVSGQGLHTLYAWAKDASGNVATSANSITMTLDSVAPVINSGPELAAASIMGGSNQTISWSITDATTTTLKIEFFNGTSWADLATSVTNTGSYSWNSVSALNVANAKLKITATDAAGNSSTASSADFIIDSTPPVIDALSLNGGAANTNNNSVQINLTAHDALSKIRYFCLKYDETTKPTSNASCWKDVTAPLPGIAVAKNITFSNYFFQLGFTKGSMTVYAWAKDEAGLISNNAAAVTDSASIYFDPGTPPKITAIQATNSDTPNNPVTAADLSAPTTGYVYIKWNASDTEGLAANPITINYTTNDTSYNTMTGGTDILNGQNGSCTVDAGYTGCVRLPSPSNGYYKIRVIAKDLIGTTIFLNSTPLNDSKLKILAGNTEDGLNGSAVSATFNTFGSAAAINHANANRLVVSDDGKIFYMDKVRGLLWIDPTTGILKKFLNVSASSTGDGGLVSNATAIGVRAIALDFQNNLLIWDVDRIRKVNLSTMIITTLIGGGAATDPTGTVNANAIKVDDFNPTSSTFIPLPNGDIIFSTPIASLHERRFRASDNKIELMDLQGQGFYSYPSDSWTTTPKGMMAVEFNPTTSAISFMMKGFYKNLVSDTRFYYARIDHTSGNETTPYSPINPQDLSENGITYFSGLDGKIYGISRFRYWVKKYDSTTNTYATVLGTGAVGSTLCTDGTLATSCKIDIDSIFITKSGRIYFIDNGVLRTIDDNKNVLTLYGQFPSYGNGSLANVARFGKIQDIKLGKSSAQNDKIIVQDIYSDEFREFTINGSIAKVTDANYIWSGPFRFDVDHTTGDILTAVSNTLRKYVRSSTSWLTLAGGGGTDYADPTADGQVGSAISYSSGYAGSVLAYIDNKIYYHKHTYLSGVYSNCIIKTYDTSDTNRQSTLIGKVGACGTGALTNSTAVSNAIIGQPTSMSNIEKIQDPNDSVSKLFYLQAGTKNLYSGNAGGTLNLFATFGSTTNAFTSNSNIDGLNFYYCSSAGFLYKHIYSTNQTVPLTWLSPTLRCKANSPTIIYHPERNSIIFAYTQNGLDGVAEYDLN